MESRERDALDEFLYRRQFRVYRKIGKNMRTRMHDEVVRSRIWKQYTKAAVHSRTDKLSRFSITRMGGEIKYWQVFQEIRKR